MTPKRDVVFLTDIVEESRMPSMTYGIREEKLEVRGNIDGLDAVKQAIYKILMTERYQYLIYDFQYGVEFGDLFGKPVSFVIPVVEKRIREALLADDRILAVTDFTFHTEREALVVGFHAETEFGEILVERKVEL